MYLLTKWIPLKKIPLNANNDKRIRLIDSIETYVYGPSKYQVCKDIDIEWTNITKQHEKCCWYYKRKHKWT